MADPAPRQAVWQARVERLIGLAAPALDLLLAAGDRFSRIVEPHDPGGYPVRSGSDASLPSDFGGSADPDPASRSSSDGAGGA